MTAKDAVPHDPTAERAVLGSIMQHRDAIVTIATKLDPEDFFLPAHRHVYAAACACYERREPPDLVTVAAELVRRDQLTLVGGSSYLAALQDAVPVAVHIEHYAAIVAGLAERRRLIAAAGQIAQLGYRPGEASAAQVRAQAVQVLLASSTAPAATVEAGQAASILWDEIREQQQPAGAWRLHLGPVGQPEWHFDWKLTMRPGTVCVIGARTSEGKTALALQLARHTAESDGKHVLFVSTEMPAADLLRRLLVTDTGLDFDTLCGRLSDEQQTAVGGALGRLGEWPGRIDFLYTQDLATVRLEALTRLAHGQLDLLVVDYLQNLQPGAGSGKRYDIVTATSAALCRLVKEDLRVPAVILSQLNRRTGLYGKDNEPELVDLRESGALEQDADIVILLQRDNEYGDARIRPTHWYRRKHRNGPLAKGTLAFDTAKFVFDSEL